MIKLILTFCTVVAFVFVCTNTIKSSSRVVTCGSVKTFSIVDNTLINIRVAIQSCELWRTATCVVVGSLVTCCPVHAWMWFALENIWKKGDTYFTISQKAVISMIQCFITDFTKVALPTKSSRTVAVETSWSINTQTPIQTASIISSALVKIWKKIWRR